jgi:hypothetical protein
VPTVHTLDSPPLARKSKSSANDNKAKNEQNHINITYYDAQEREQNDNRPNSRELQDKYEKENKNNNLIQEKIHATDTEDSRKKQTDSPNSHASAQSNRPSFNFPPNIYMNGNNHNPDPYTTNFHRNSHYNYGNNTNTRNKNYESHHNDATPMDISATNYSRCQYLLLKKNTN